MQELLFILACAAAIIGICIFIKGYYNLLCDDVDKADAAMEDGAWLLIPSVAYLLCYWLLSA